MEKGIENYLSKFPKEYMGFIFVAFGAIILIGAWFNWDWVLEGDGRAMNIAWISNTFGRNVARVIMGVMGVLIMIIGFVIFFLMRP